MPGAIGFGPALVMRREGTAATWAAAAFDFTGGVLPAGASLTRGSTATRINAAGLLVSEAADVARFDFDPATLALRGVLVEPAATNLMPGSAAIGGASWTLQGVSVAGSATAPDGTTTATLLRMPAGAAKSAYRLRSGVVVGGASYALSLWVRRPATAGADNVRITTTNGAAYSTGISQRIALTPSWTRVVVSGAVSTNTNVAVVIGNTDVTGAADTLVAGDVELFGIQIETGGAATRYVPTTTATVTRAADVLTLDWSAKHVADGGVTLRLTFDDGSTQDVAATVTGGISVVPATLNRAAIQRIDRV